MQQITSYHEQQVASYLQHDALDATVPSSPNTATEKTPEAKDVSPGTDFISLLVIMTDPINCSAQFHVTKLGC